MINKIRNFLSVPFFLLLIISMVVWMAVAGRKNVDDYGHAIQAVLVKMREDAENMEDDDYDDSEDDDDDEGDYRRV